MKKQYTAPEIMFADFKTKERIADTCWGLTETHTHQYTRYYDVEGPGYVSFNVIGGSGSCSNPDAYNIHYYEYKGEAWVDGSKYEAELERALMAKGGNGGQPYKEIAVDFPVRPDPSWS